LFPLDFTPYCIQGGSDELVIIRDGLKRKLKKLVWLTITPPTQYWRTYAGTEDYGLK
jgi:hypothetical protein